MVQETGTAFKNDDTLGSQGQGNVWTLSLGQACVLRMKSAENREEYAKEENKQG